MILINDSDIFLNCIKSMQFSGKLVKEKYLIFEDNVNKKHNIFVYSCSSLGSCSLHHGVSSVL